jgi:hypothetical protein
LLLLAGTDLSLPLDDDMAAFAGTAARAGTAAIAGTASRRS